jgi:hypothetical protein
MQPEDMIDTSIFSTLEIVGLFVSLLGLLPVLSLYQEETRWLTVAYVLLVIGMVATNLEAVVLGGVLNFVEHGIGIGLAGLMFFATAYLHRQANLTEDDPA